MSSLYLVEYPFAIGARQGVGEPCNRLKFNGDARTESLMSGPTGVARASHGALALLVIKVVPKPGWGALARLRVKLFVGNGRWVSYLMGDECACE